MVGGEASDAYTVIGRICGKMFGEVNKNSHPVLYWKTYMDVSSGCSPWGCPRVD